tara:strand:+ start:361 stop:789 length:429 start_codon:yes stop_codon:yes gene_type:complete
MTLLAVKTFFKKVWAWIVKYWQYFALACYTVVVVVLLRNKNNVDSIKAAFKQSKESHKKEVEAINSAHKEEILKRDKIIEDYNKTLMKLDEEYKKQKLELKEWEKKKIKKIVEETHNDPEGRTKQIANEFGFELVTIDDETD